MVTSMFSSCFKVHKLIVNSPIVTFMRVVVIDVLCHIASLFKIIIPSRYLLLSLLLPLSFLFLNHFTCLLLLFRTLQLFTRNLPIFIKT